MGCQVCNFRFQFWVPKSEAIFIAQCPLIDYRPTMKEGEIVWWGVLISSYSEKLRDIVHWIKRNGVAISSTTSRWYPLKVPISRRVLNWQAILKTILPPQQLKKSTNCLVAILLHILSLYCPLLSFVPLVVPPPQVLGLLWMKVYFWVLTNNC